MSAANPAAFGPADPEPVAHTDPIPLVPDEGAVARRRRAPVGVFDDPTEHPRPLGSDPSNPSPLVTPIHPGTASPTASLPAQRHASMSDDPSRRHRAGDPVENADPSIPDSVRRQAVERLALVGRRHARHRTDLRATADRPGPHVIVFFYRRTPADGPEQLAISTRMFLDGPDVTDLTEVLHTLRERAREYRHAGWFDPRRHLSNSGEHLAIAGRYHGIGTSTLLPAGPDEPSWQGLARFVDGTQLLMRSTHSARALHVETTHTLDVPAFLALGPAYDWRWATPSPWRDPSHVPTELDTARAALDELHAFITDPDALREDLGVGHLTPRTSARLGRSRRPARSP